MQTKEERYKEVIQQAIQDLGALTMSYCPSVEHKELKIIIKEVSWYLLKVLKEK